MKAYQLIDRLASLDEAAPVEEPIVEPTEAPPAERPRTPSRRPSRDPFELPPDFEPGQMPRPKANDESEQIGNWLKATQQPIQDWEWDGHELRMLMDDGTTEVYSRGQLEEAGVFAGETAFAESLEDEGGAEGESLYPDPVGPDMETVDAAIAAEEVPNDEAAGTLDFILGRNSGGCECGAPAPEAAAAEIVPVEGEKAEELVQAVGDLVGAIIGLVGAGAGEGEAMVAAGEDAPKDSDKDDDKSDDKKSDKSKKKKEKSKDKDEDKESDKKEDKDDDKDE